jgi:LacI family transcriptional regulator
MSSTQDPKIGLTRSRPTMHDVAKLARVSLKTVSRVVNGEPSVDQRTRARVEEAITTLGFRPNGLASSLRRGRSSSVIGLVIEDINNPFYSNIARGVEDVAHQHRFMIIISSIEKSSSREQNLVNEIIRRRVEGLIVVPTTHDHSYLATEIKHGMPIVFLDRPPEHLTGDSVLLDNRGGTKRGIEYLIAQRHTRIGFVGGDPSIYTGSERLAGYQEALQSHGIPIHNDLMRFARHDVLQAENATHELLALDEPPTAIFADNNRMSIGVIRALRHYPYPVALVGFDDIELADMLAMPITVITHNDVEMGHHAAQLLFDRINGDTRPSQQLIIPTQLVVYGTPTIAK